MAPFDRFIAAVLNINVKIQTRMATKSRARCAYGGLDWKKENPVVVFKN